MGKVTIEIMRLPHGQGLELPAYQSAGAAGMDRTTGGFVVVVAAPS